MTDPANPSAPGSQGGNAAGGDASDMKPITLADLKALLAGELPKVVNSAVATHLKRERDKAAKEAAEKAKAEQEGEGDVEGQQSGATSKPAPKAPEAAREPDPELVKLRKELDSLKAQNKEEQRLRKEATRKAAEEKGHAAVRSALTGKVAAGAERLAHDALRARGALTIDDDGVARVRLGDADEPEDGRDLQSGIEAFLKTKEAEFLKPAPKDGQRRGAFGNGAQVPQGQRASPDDAFAARTGQRLDDVL